MINILIDISYGDYLSFGILLTQYQSISDNSSKSLQDWRREQKERKKESAADFGFCVKYGNNEERRTIEDLQKMITQRSEKLRTLSLFCEAWVR